MAGRSGGARLRTGDDGELRGGNAAFNAGVIRSVLEGEQGAHRDIGILNAAAALARGGACRRPRERAAAGSRVNRPWPGPRCARCADCYVPRRSCSGSRADPPGAERGAWTSGSSAGESGWQQGDDAYAEAAAAHAGPEDPGMADQVLDQLVDGGQRDPVVDRQAAMPLCHDLRPARSGCRGPASARPRPPWRTRSPRDGPAGAARGRSARSGRRARSAQWPAQDVRRPFASARRVA